MDNIITLHDDLVNKTYVHGGYRERHIWDPKHRLIHVAPVRDRLLHHAIYRILYPLFDRTFIADSFSCRLDKGTHKALNRFRAMVYKVSRNHTRTCWVLKCDIRKFFASVDQQVLLNILQEYIPDQGIVWLLGQVIGSFTTFSACHSHENGNPANTILDPRFHGDNNIACGDDRVGNGDDRRIGLPLGNLTSQLFANVYLNVFDQFIKHKLKVRYYIRYADDFVLLFEDRGWLADVISTIHSFLREKLHLMFHPDKIILKTIASGVDFLGLVHFSDHRVLRSATKQRMMRRLADWQPGEFAIIESYLGLLRHCNGYGLSCELRQHTLYDGYWKYGIMYPR